MKIIRIKHGTFHISYYYFTASTLQTPNWKLVETTKEYKDGYAKCIQVLQNHYPRTDVRCINKNIRCVGEY